MGWPENTCRSCGKDNYNRSYKRLEVRASPDIKKIQRLESQLEVAKGSLKIYDKAFSPKKGFIHIDSNYSELHISATEALKKIEELENASID